MPDEGGPYLSRRAADWLIDSEATLLGVDFGMPVRAFAGVPDP